MHYRRAFFNSSHDYEQMVLLQNQNLFSNLNKEERRDGFLLTAFTAEDFFHMNQDLCVMLAVSQKENQEKIHGYLCANIFIKNSRFEFIKTMYEFSQNISYKQKLLSQYKAFVPSPICIDKINRGTNVFFRLCNKLLQSKFITDDYELAVTLISVNNTKSMKACCGIGFKQVGQFYLGDNLFVLLILDLLWI